MNLGDRPALPAFPAPMSSLQQPVIATAGWNRTRLTAGVLAFAAATAVIVGTFVPLYVGEVALGDQQALTMSVNAWRADVTGGDQFTDVPVNGYPLAFAAIALFCAAGMAVAAAMPAASPGTRRLAAGVTAVSAALLTGTVWTITLQAVVWVDSFSDVGAIDASASHEGGFWLLLAAMAASLVAAVLVLLPTNGRRREPRSAPVIYAVQPDDADEETPPSGFAVPVLLPQQAGAPALPAEIEIPPPPPMPAAPPPPAVTGSEDPLAPPPGGPEART